MRKTAIIFLLFTITLHGFAQEVPARQDTLPAPATDSVLIKKNGKIITVESYAKRYQPRKALLYAAVLPGMGQIYNKKYWKVPLVYGGFAIITSIGIYYNQRYEQYKSDLFYVLENPGSTSPGNNYTEAQLRSLTDAYRRQRDFFIILDAFWYILQMVDAHVDAHLKEFDLNPQLKVSLAPSVQTNYLVGQSTGLSLTFKF
jgi:hypothetical protein